MELRALETLFAVWCCLMLRRMANKELYEPMILGRVCVCFELRHAPFRLLITETQKS
jgi:hypothetical protein